MIDTLCTECASLIENHEKIQVLSAVHYNLGKTLQDVQNIVALPHEAGSAEAMLKEDVQLMQVQLKSNSAYSPTLKDLQVLQSWRVILASSDELCIGLRSYEGEAEKSRECLEVKLYVFVLIV